MMFMLLLLIIFLNDGFIACLAPGTVTLNISSELDARQSDKVLLSYAITKSEDLKKKIIVNTLTELKRNYRGKYKASISFRVDNVTQIMELSGNLMITFRKQIRKRYELEKMKFQFNAKFGKFYNGILIVTKSSVSKNLEKDFIVELTVQCNDHYYPAYNCSRQCIRTENTKHCDSHGNKICQLGYFLSPDKNLCELDWCQVSKNKCKNGGTCISRSTTIQCECSPFYTGSFCETYIDLCQRHKCPNNTRCVVKNSFVDCERRQPSVKISQTYWIMAIVLVCILLVIVTISLACFNCINAKTQKSVANGTHGSVNLSLKSYQPTNNTSRSSSLYVNTHQRKQHECLCSGNNSIRGSQQNVPMHHQQQRYYNSLRHPHRTTQLNRSLSDQAFASMSRRHSQLLFPLPLQQPSMLDVNGSVHDSILEQREVMPSPPADNFHSTML